MAARAAQQCPHCRRDAPRVSFRPSHVHVCRIMQLNPQQEIVANHVRGRILTLAGPGSGKTRTLTERTARLIRRGADPASIVCLTFTNKARDEMRTRIAAATPASTSAAADKVFISNFHGLCGTLLRR